MSTTYITRQPMTLVQAEEILTKARCEIGERDGMTFAIDPQGAYFWLTDDASDYTNLAINLDSGEMQTCPTAIRDGTVRVIGEQFGQNGAEMMATLLDMVSEYEDEYHEIMGSPLDEDAA